LPWLLDPVPEYIAELGLGYVQVVFLGGGVTFLGVSACLEAGLICDGNQQDILIGLIDHVLGYVVDSLLIHFASSEEARTELCFSPWFMLVEGRALAPPPADAAAYTA
jgi:hypothetical protein